MFIFILEQYCRSNQIKLIWSTWADYNNFDAMFKETYEYYRSGENNLIMKHVFDCYNHERLKIDYPDIFNQAADIHHGNPHPGVHWHQHVAEFFINNINKELS